MDQSVSVMLMFAAILIFAGLLSVLIALTKKGPKQLDVDKYRSRWMSIEQNLRRDDPNTFQLTVLDADKLLDQALRERNIPGNTMGERMKQLQKTWTSANSVWAAHKLRNHIAHESNVRVEYDSARRALAAFKQALKDVGAI